VGGSANLKSFSIVRAMKMGGRLEYEQDRDSGERTSPFREKRLNAEWKLGLLSGVPREGGGIFKLPLARGHASRTSGVKPAAFKYSSPVIGVSMNRKYR